MKRLLSAIFIMSCSFLSAQMPSAETSSARQFILEGKISDTVSLPPFCGYIAFATVVELEISSYSDSTYESDRICVIFMCPREKGGDFFTIGRELKLVVQDKNPTQFGWAISDQEKLKQNQLAYDLWVIEILNK